jgi:dTDP-4-amino-4,6-dideoxy-D-glucose ammonia-lyase
MTVTTSLEEQLHLQREHFHPQILQALLEDIKKKLGICGLFSAVSTESELMRWVDRAMQIVITFAAAPFTTQQEVSTKIGIERGELCKLNAVLRSSDLAQDIISSHGFGAKYWQNTIIPLIQSGAVEDVLTNTFRIPYRIGIYPGASCMFFCSFCGRNHAAAYDHADVHMGNQLFKTMFQATRAGDSDQFYISGGLEPLTNFGIGDLIHTGAKHGLRLSMYTNGYMLTPHLLEQQTGFWDLNLVRISLYGTNQATTQQVTQNKKAFGQVTKNLKTLLHLRNVRQSPLKIGLNFVILPGQVEQIRELAEYIGEINRDAGSSRQIDFLTLREDYSAIGDDGLAVSEQTQLADLFAELEERRQLEDLCDLYIDYGYGLHGMRMGAMGKLAFVDHTTMRPGAYPQISVVIDLLGDVYLYREAGFLARAGALRYRIGRVSESHSLEEIVRNYLDEHCFSEPRPGDTMYMDSFDHAVTNLLNQADADMKFGIPFSDGPVRHRIYLRDNQHNASANTVAHPTLFTSAEASYSGLTQTAG